MSLFTWFKSEAKTPGIGEMIEAGTARVAELKATIASVVTDAADGAEGAQERYRAAKDDLAKVTADLELLVAARAEHTEREARKLQQARAAAHRERVALVKADLDASVKHAERFEHHLAEAMREYDALIASRGAALTRNVRMPDKAGIRLQEVRQLVGNEMYKAGARLNDVCANSAGLPAPEVQDLRWRSDPRQIPPLADRLRAVDTHTLSQLEQATPQ
jgi:hypothetical protein